MTQIALNTTTPRRAIRISSGEITVHISRPITESELEGQPLDQSSVIEFVRCAGFLTNSVEGELLGDSSTVVFNSVEEIRHQPSAGSSDEPVPEH